jgi:tetratricopeptide (TPR) repeat protein
MNAIERALQINGTSVEALRLGAVILGHAGRGEQAVEYAQRAIRFSPLDPSIVHSYNALGIAHCPARNWDGVASACGKAIQANPRFSLPLVLQAAALSFLGRWDEAKAAARRVPELEPGFTVSGFVKSHTGRPEIWEPIGDALRRLGLAE